MRRSIIIGSIAVLIAAAGATYWFFTRPAAVAFSLAPSTAAPAASSTPLAPPRTPPAGYTEYRDTTYRFSLFYPSELAAKTYDEGGGAATIDFQNVQKAEGFQIFIVPYSGTTVSEQRFEEDEPSGVRNDMKTGTLAGVSAAAFYSNDSRLGETYEVWFIHGGYLFEVTTLKPLDTWLQDIMQSLVFI